MQQVISLFSPDWVEVYRSSLLVARQRALGSLHILAACFIVEVRGLPNCGAMEQNDICI